MDVALYQDTFTSLAVTFMLWAITTYVAYSLGYYSLLKKNTTTPFISISLMECVGAFLSFIVAQVVIVPIAIFLLLIFNFGSEFPRIDSLPLSLKVWINVFSILSGGIFLIFYALAVKGKEWKLFFGKSSLAFSHFIFGFVSWVVCYPGFLLLTVLLDIILRNIFGFDPAEEQVAIRHLKATFQYPLPFSLTLIAVLTVVPLTEELLFRGFLQNVLRKKFDSKVSIVIASLVFTFFHFSLTQGVYNLKLLPLLFYLSCYLGFCYERQNSLWAPIALHSLFNLLNVALIINSAN